MSDNEITERLMRLVERRGVNVQNKIPGRIKARRLFSVRVRPEARLIQFTK